MSQLLKNSKWNFLELLMGVLFALVVFPSKTKAVFITLFGVIVVFLRFKKGWFFNKKLFFTNALIYVALLITVIYSKNISYAIYKLQTMSSLFFFPLIFSLFTKEEMEGFYKKRTHYLFIFISGVFLLNIVPFIWYWTTHYSLQEIIIHYPKIIQVDIGGYGIHPIYLSIYISLSIFFTVLIYGEIKSKRNRFLLLTMNIVSVFFLFLYARKTPIIALLVTLFIWGYLINNKKKRFYLMGIIVVTTVMVFVIPTTRNRFVELLSVTSISKGKETSSNIRYTLFETSIELIKKAPLFGYGVGDFHDKIIESNKEKGFLNIAKYGYNSHNQYLSFLMIGGLFFFIFFVYFYQKNLYDSLKNQNHVLFLIFVFYGVSMLTENILERENGVIYFSLFVNFFYNKRLNIR